MADDEKKGGGEKSGSNVGKIIAVVFGTVLAPVLVAVGVKWLDPARFDNKPDATKDNKKDEPPGTGGSGQSPIVPKFGGDLITPNLDKNFYSYGWSEQGQAFKRDDKVDPKLFKYIKESPGSDAARPTILVPGDGRDAYLGTKEECDNYTLHVWWKWGDPSKTFGPREGKPRQASILLHTFGQEGQLSNSPLPKGIHIALNEGGAIGSIRLWGAEREIACKTKVKQLPGGRPTFVYDPGQPQLRDLFSPRYPPGRTEWNGTIFRLNYDPARRTDDKPGPAGSNWFKFQIDCEGPRVTVRIGSAVVCAIGNCNKTKGRIGFASQGAEWYIGKIELTRR
jgi:hypothetical protein